MTQYTFTPGVPGILLLSHGPFCQALLQSAQMIAGTAKNLVALPLYENSNIDDYGTLAMETFRAMPDGSIVLFDLASGTPFNQMMIKSNGTPFPGLCGVSLPVLLEALALREVMQGQELISVLLESARAAVVDIRAFFEP